MARAIQRLSARAASNAKPGMHADGGGLYLQVTATLARSWIFRFARDKRTHDMGLGPLHTVSLAQAREAALLARQALRDGLDPIAQRKAARSAAAGVPVFRVTTANYITEHTAGWKSAKHAEQWTNTLDTYAMPFIGDKPVDQVTTEDMLRLLQPIWATKTETATRVRQRIEAVLDAEIAKSGRSRPNPARWKGHLAKLLPKPSKVRKTKHFAALPYAELPAFMAKLRARRAGAARALEFTILAAARTGMTVGAIWSEIHGNTWTVPAERMKAGREHVTPLSPAVVALLAQLPRDSSTGHVFQGVHKSHLSTAAMDTLLGRMGYGHVTVHGFRSTFKDWAGETTHFANEVSEAALAHQVKDKTEAAYRRGAMLAKRRKLMDAWARYCSKTPASSDTTPPPPPAASPPASG